VRALAALVVICIAAAGCDRDAVEARPAPNARLKDARRTDEQAEFDRQRRPDVVIATIGLKPGDVVADVGAGTGLLTVHVARAVQPGGRVVATDVDSAVLDLLDARVQAAGLGDVVEQRVVGPTDPGLEPATYDVILLAQVDHYFDDPVDWLKKAMPALRSGGRIVITNRVHHRAGGFAAAEAAGLKLVRETTDIPGQYVAVFQVP
jgi:ubiquinone/menaquinone biosynthesis C-methylase UbiE